MSNIIYQTDADGLFIGAIEARESPLEPGGVYLIPAGCVEIAPPDPEAGKAAVWSGTAWAMVPDHRGETWYDGREPVVIDFVGDPAERGYSASAPALTLDDLRAGILAAIVATADALLAAGAAVEGGLHVALDTDSRFDLTAMAVTAASASAGTVPWPESYARGWITVENVRIPLATPAAGQAFAASVGDWYASVMQHRRDLKDAALAAEDVAALDAIDITTGWPA